eukprot:CAMPEP_0178935122 /NCGR_PEP_ID=MMETSP0786-20121207/24323_1 /TAXON_ID=186022 /ORGANISM="Thalassionema frauenfeldii, Strain CCMP 1798" /LENGTH=255 /DNA_ID=CAMNT_0020613141 /DNA_START=8 /DNA_END=775 /DNA_ORIENTATION=+
MEQSTSLKLLDEKRQALEVEAEAIVLELQSEQHGRVGMEKPLVDAEGYPLADIDIYRIRSLRSRWNQIQTDHKQLMKQMESQFTNSKKNNLLTKTTPQDEAKELQARRAVKPKPKFDAKTGKWVVMNWDGSVAGVENGDKRSFAHLEREEEVEAMDATATNDNRAWIPFAKINYVAPNSPAANASMEEGVRFGDIDFRNHNDLKAVGALVPKLAESQRSVELQILRQSSKLFLKLSPQTWNGRGLLGCHIVKYEE